MPDPMRSKISLWVQLLNPKESRKNMKRVRKFIMCFGDTALLHFPLCPSPISTLEPIPSMFSPMVQQINLIVIPIPWLIEPWRSNYIKWTSAWMKPTLRTVYLHYTWTSQTCMILQLYIVFVWVVKHTGFMVVVIVILVYQQEYVSPWVHHFKSSVGVLVDFRVQYDTRVLCVCILQYTDGKYTINTDRAMCSWTYTYNFHSKGFV